MTEQTSSDNQRLAGERAGVDQSRELRQLRGHGLHRSLKFFALYFFCAILFCNSGGLSTC